MPYDPGSAFPKRETLFFTSFFPVYCILTYVACLYGLI